LGQPDLAFFAGGVAFGGGGRSDIKLSLNFGRFRNQTSSNPLHCNFICCPLFSREMPLMFLSPAAAELYSEIFFDENML
jgi:hypothetical protein